MIRRKPEAVRTVPPPLPPRVVDAVLKRIYEAIGGYVVHEPVLLRDLKAEKRSFVATVRVQAASRTLTCRARGQREALYQLLSAVAQACADEHPACAVAGSAGACVLPLGHAGLHRCPLGGSTSHATSWEQTETDAEMVVEE